MCPLETERVKESNYANSPLKIENTTKLIKKFKEEDSC